MPDTGRALMWQVFGQDHLLLRLEPALAQGRYSHAYLLTGPPHVGKMTLAVDLARAVNCQRRPGAPCGDCAQCTRIAAGIHADVRVVGLDAEGRDQSRASRTVIGIDDVKDVLRLVNLNPYEGSSTVVIFDGADSMSPEAANALLKTLEEPPPQVLFLLLAEDEETVLTTIRSRCQTLPLRPLSHRAMVEWLTVRRQGPPPESSPVSTEEADRLFRLSQGCLGWAITALGDPQVLEQRQADLERMLETMEAGLETRFAYANEVASLFTSNRGAAKELLGLWLRWWRDLLLIKEGADQYLHNADRLDDLRAYAAGLTTGQIARSIRRLTGAMTALDRNASARLALEVLMLELPSVGRFSPETAESPAG